MNILVITQYFYPETFRVNTLCCDLVNRGHKVTVLTGYPQYPQGKIYDNYGFNKPYDKYWNGIKIERIKMKPRGKTPIGLFLNCWSFVAEGKKWVKKCKEKFDVVYVFEVSPVTVGLPAVEYKKKFDTPILFNVQDLWPENVEVVLGIHNRIVIGIINKIVDKIYSNSDRILCSSNGFVKNIAARGVRHNKLIYWPQFCTQPDFDSLQKPEIYNDRYFNIVFTGNIGNAQGLDLLVDSAKLLNDSSVRWYIVGDGRERERLQKKVKDLRLEESVFFVGKVSEEEANAYIYYADLTYLSFKQNKVFDMTIPAKLQSYLSSGTPILAVASGETKAIVNEAKAGIVCEYSPEDVVRAIQDRDPLFVECRDDIKLSSKRYFEEHFTKAKLVDELEDIMDSVKN